MNVNFEYYKIFYYVAKYQNFTRAAHALGNSQPNVTRAMNCLEQETHCTLFIRTNRGVQLTPEGEHLYGHIAAAMAQVQMAEEELAASASLEHGSVSIGASETALNIYLLEKLKAFHTEYPGIRLKMYNHSTPQAVRSVGNGEIDFAVVTTPTNAEPPLQEVHLQSFREILVGGLAYTALASQELTLSDLEHYSFISLGKETMTYRFYHQPTPRRPPPTRSCPWCSATWALPSSPKPWPGRPSRSGRLSRFICGRRSPRGRSAWCMTASAP